MAARSVMTNSTSVKRHRIEYTCMNTLPTRTRLHFILYIYIYSRSESILENNRKTIII